MCNQLIFKVNDQSIDLTVYQPLCILTITTLRSTIFLTSNYRAFHLIYKFICIIYLFFVLFSFIHICCCCVYVSTHLCAASAQTIQFNPYEVHTNGKIEAANVSTMYTDAHYQRLQYPQCLFLFPYMQVGSMMPHHN